MNKKLIQLELTFVEAQLIKAILEKHHWNTKYVVDTKNPINKDDLDARMNAMQNVITQIKEGENKNDK